MRNTWKVLLASALVSGSFASFAQTPAAAPAAAPASKAAAPAAAPAPAATPAAPAAAPATKAAAAAAPGTTTMQNFVCKDGSSISAATSKGACSGHKGIDKDATAKAAAGGKTAKTAAPGGGAGKVWANEESKVYHCQGSRYYGTTQNGKYVTEAEAKAAGMHGANNKSCS